MPTYHTTGIVIGRTNFGEADRVIRFFTPDRGKLSAVAKGVRKIKSRSGGHLELLGEVNLMLATGHNLDIVTSARLIWYPHDLATAYDRLGLAFMIATIADRLTEPDQPQPELYHLLSEALHAVDGGATGPLPELWFKLRLLNILGYHPQLTNCIVCGRHGGDLSYAFSSERGGITCTDDADATSRPMSQSAIKLWRLLSDYSYTSISQIADAPTLAADTLLSCDEFFEHHLGRTFKPHIG